MSTLIQRQEANHWYSRSGQAHYTVLRSDGEGSRPTTIADARKLGLLPSVTTIMRALAKPNVEDWRVEQAILQAGVTEWLTGMTEAQYVEAVSEPLEGKLEQARMFGTLVHSGVEYVANNLQRPPVLSCIGARTQPVSAWVSAFRDWQSSRVKSVYAAESTVVNTELGYAGRIDLHLNHVEYGPVVVDCKTQNVRKSPVFYPEWSYQLAAYQKALPTPARIMSLVLDSNDPAGIHEKLWTEQETQHGWEVFSALFQFWKKLKKYDPTKL